MNLAEAKQVLLEHGQQQLLKYYDELDEGAKKALLDQISKINFSSSFIIAFSKSFSL